MNAVPSLDVLRSTIIGSPSSSRRSSVVGTQIMPRPYLAMKFTASGVIASAAIMKSPSFSRSSSSTTMIIFPALMSSMASGIPANECSGCCALRLSSLLAISW